METGFVRLKNSSDGKFFKETFVEMQEFEELILFTGNSDFQIESARLN